MKKVLKIFLPIILLVITLIFFIKDDLILWNITNKYNTDPSSINRYSDIPEAICEDAREVILNAYLVKKTLSEKNLTSTVELIRFLRSCISKSSTTGKQPLYKKTFEVLMIIYKQAKNENIRQNIAQFLKEEDIKAFYQYFEMTQRDSLLFYDASYTVTKYPKLSKESSTIEKDLWCKNVHPKIEADFITLLELDIHEGRNYQLVEMYETINCNNDKLYLRKIQFSAWSELLVNLEEEFYASQNPQDGFDLRDAGNKFDIEAKNQLENTSFFALLHLNTEEDKKKFLLYILDSPIKSRLICLKLVFYICNEYGSSMDKDVVSKAKVWRELVAEKYPELSIEKEWEHQLLLGGTGSSWRK